jgi:chromate transporter
MQISKKAAFLYWLKLGFISFGGPAGQIAIMHQDLVEKKRWISEKRFLHALNFCMLLPGPEAQQLAIYIGWLMHRTWGGVVAGVLFILPSFFILIGLAWVTLQYGDVPAVAGALAGVKPAVVAIILVALHRIGSRTLKNPLMWTIATFAFVGIFFLKIPFPVVILVAALVGFFGQKIKPEYFSLNTAHNATERNFGKAIIDDDTPTPPHAIFSWQRMAKVLVVGLGIWLISFAYLLVQFGWQGAFTQMAWFFTKAALLTFGGAYAVLPYVYQGAVEHYGWLNISQMMNGLALGETTPGPLIMVVTYVGFAAGWSQQVYENHQFLSAFAAAGIVTFFTFLPSFVFIFLGAPMIETTHNQLKFTAPLSAITAAVVGVILNLACFFAEHVFWESGINSPLNWQALFMILIATIALFKFKINVVLIIISFAIAGTLLNLIAVN